ncbi:RNA polymerase sigma factor [Cohnella zeiphila]|uniref:Sigma-70 family RNA polymerase sigma factor n=1 Tax=Cohnella zeiphila TaxID=2761120 RepID=A0A7X0SKT2_9BACL|nr:sigma-70 family RNA polymerase sigma factor [Cohnella zeiphila]MBB6731837.1 sigma-70 family RNA polymerase sigma factor [Cohnella zeiphila]
MPSQLPLLSSGNFEELHSSVQREIYKEYYELVYGVIYFMVRDHASTEDLIQDSFLKVVSHVPDIADDVKLRSWIRTVVKNTVYSFMRKQKNRRNETDVDNVLMMSDQEIIRSSESVETEIELKIMSETVGECLRELKPEYQALIELRWKRELSYKEMAEMLNTSEETIKHKLHRAREAVRKRFLKRWGEPSDARRFR